MRLFYVVCLAAILLVSCSSSDNADDTTHNPVDASLKVTVTASVIDEGNGFIGIGDVINYTISVQNTGEVNLSNLVLESTLKDFSDNSLNLDVDPTFVSATLGSELGVILVSEIVTYTASFNITQNEVNTNGLSLSITVNATTPNNQNVSDISDNGDDSDGNTNDDNTEIYIEFNPLIIAEYHILNSNGDPATKYLFNENGRFKEMHTENTKVIFGYDSNDKIINITTTDMNDILIESQDIIYSSENRIESIGTRVLDYYEAENYYIDTSNYNSDGPFNYEEDGIPYEEYEFYYHKYEVSDVNPIVKLCLFSGNQITNLNTGEVQNFGDCSEFESNNYSNNVNNECGDIDCIGFGYDSNINPLQGSTNLIDVYGFIRIFPFGAQPSKLNILINSNNLTLMNYSDPSYLEYDYEFNDNNLPITGSRQYIDELGPGDVNAYSRYYYQGDAIPD